MLVLVCPGDGGRPPAAPPPPVPHLGPPLACPHGPALTDTDAEGGTAGGRGRARGRGDAPGLTLVEGEGLHRGGDATEHGLGPGPTTEAEPETGTETGDDTHHTDEQGFTLQPLLGGFFFLISAADFFLFVCLFVFAGRSRSSSRQGTRRRGRSSGSHRRGDSDSRSPPQSLNRANHSPSPPHRGAQPSAIITVCDKLRKYDDHQTEQPD